MLIFVHHLKKFRMNPWVMEGCLNGTREKLIAILILDFTQIAPLGSFPFTLFSWIVDKQLEI